METSPLLPESSKQQYGPQLRTLEGVRCFATFFIIFGHALNWQRLNDPEIDDSLFLDRLYFLVADLQKVVSFWFILSGFTLSWSSMRRDMSDVGQPAAV